MLTLTAGLKRGKWKTRMRADTDTDADADADTDGHGDGTRAQKGCVRVVHGGMRRLLVILIM